MGIDIERLASTTRLRFSLAAGPAASPGSMCNKMYTRWRWRVTGR